MASLKPITGSTDAGPTVFAPRDSVSGLSTLIASNGVPIADKRLTIQSSRTPAGKSKVAINLVLPVVQDVVVNGVSRPTPVRTAYAKVEMTFDGTSNPTERQSVRQLLFTLLSTAEIADVVDNNNPLY